MCPASEINNAMSQLPTAEGCKIMAVSDEGKIVEEVPGFKAIRVTNSDNVTHYVNVPSTRYQIVQHEEAFRPIVEALTQAGVHDFNFIMNATEKKANMQIYVGGEGYESVNVGFSVVNSFDGSHALNYGIKQTFTQSSLELVGYRQICSNGMKIKVPLAEAEIIRPEVVTRVKELFSEQTRILHTKTVFEKIEAIQYVVEAVSLLRQPVENMIKKAQQWTITDQLKLKEMIKLHVGRRFAARVNDAFGREDHNLWGLYNSMTYVASHDRDLSPTSRDTLQTKAAEMLYQELKVKV